MALTSLKEIKEKTLWVARFPGVRYCGTYEQVGKYASDEDCKDFDILYIEGQPFEVRPFWEDYDRYCTEHKVFLTIDEFYPIWEKMRTDP